MFKNIRIDVLLIILSSICWVSLTAFTFQLTDPEWDFALDKVFHGEKVLSKNVFLSFFFLSIYLFFLDFERRNRSSKPQNFEWQVIAINIFCLFLHLIILYLEHYIVVPTDNLAIWLNFLNNFNILIGTVFSANCFFYFKRLILFQKTYTVHTIWRIFEWMIFLSILLTVFNVNIKEPMVFFGLLVYAIMAMYLSTQMRWVAFLSKRQKIQTIFYFFLFTIIVSLILQNFFFESYTFGENAHAHLLVIDCAHKFFLLSTFTFVLFYTISSLLILLFHLPTSGVFEEKLNINNSFKDLSQNLSKYKKHDDIYQILLDTVLSSSTSKYGWIKHVDETEARFAKNISAEDLQSIYSFINQTKRKKNQFSQTHVQKIHKQNNLPFFSEKKIHSMLITPIFIENVQVAEIGVLKKLSNGFDIEMMEIISSYVSQASVSVENIELLNKALENERYKEEIKIAKKVKQKLINQHLTISENIQTAFYSVSSDSVGGDFFDVHSFSEKLHLFVIGDVAGNGTAAAFNLAQLKGIFKSLVQNIVDFEQYPKVFNQALYECFEKNSFVSLSFFLINEENQTIKHFRCGHVPAIHINENSTKVLNPRGIGLGMVENEQMLPLTQMQIFDYQSEDILFCYTDGLIETVSKEKKKFEIEELTHIISNNYNQNATFVVEKVKQTFHEFLGKEDINTDVSFVCIKFK